MSRFDPDGMFDFRSNDEIFNANKPKTSSSNDGRRTRYSCVDYFPDEQTEIFSESTTTIASGNNETIALRKSGKDCWTVKMAKEYNVARRNTNLKENYFNLIVTPALIFAGGGFNGFKNLVKIPTNMMQAASQGMDISGVLQAGFSVYNNLNEGAVNINCQIHQRIQ